jgi:glycosyltransferase involved in cell wall biosynthesis
VPAPDAVLVGYLGHFDVRLARRLFRRTPIVLDHLVSAAGTARDRGIAGGGAKTRLLRAIDDGALRRADVVVVDTPEHEAALPPAVKDRAVIAPVGAGAEWFALGRDRSYPGGPLKVIFVGVFTPLHGTRYLGQALADLAGDDIDVTMVGTGQEYEACRAAAAGNPRVTWRGWVPGEQLPALVAAHDVSLGIFGTTPKALNVVPTKVYQGAAAGCAIVTSDTAPQRAALGEAAVLVPPGDPAALAAALRRLAKDRTDVARLGRAAHARAIDRFQAAAVVADVRARVLAGGLS